MKGGRECVCVCVYVCVCVRVCAIRDRKLTAEMKDYGNYASGFFS